MVLFILGLCVFLFGFFYLEDRLTKAFLIVFPLLPALTIIEDKFFVDDTKEGYGCVLEIDSGYHSPPYLVVENNNKKKTVSLWAYKKTIKKEIIGTCIEYIYYVDILGHEILVEIK